MNPDFCIAGAAKCGTTALFSYLRSQPGVFMPAMKEPKFFCCDLKTSGGVYDAAGYQALFAQAPPGSLTGEASAMYLYSEVALARLMAHNPMARIIVLLRHPIDAAYSLHAARWNYGHENLADFEQAWRAQRARLAGEGLPPRWPDARTLQYGAIYRYAPQVKRLLQHVPVSQRRIYLYEEFFAAPHWHFAQLLDFLALKGVAPRSFAPVNAALGMRSRSIDRWLRMPPQWLRRLHAPLRPLLKVTGIRPLRLLRTLNLVPQAKPDLPPALRDELQRYFAPDIAELEGLLERPLWRDNSSSSASARTGAT